MSKIVFNNIPRKGQPFPFDVFDNEIDLSVLKLSFRIYEDDYERSASLGIDVKGSHVHIADIKLYHSDKLFNFERTFDSSEILLQEIVKRFNSFFSKGQQCLEF